MKKTSVFTLALLLTLAATTLVQAHCQIPCGIYGDATRFDLMREHVTTIEKSMKSIVALSKADSSSANQLSRWVTNKETHADELTEIVTFYFLAQRIKPAPKSDKKAYAAYQAKLTVLHDIIVGAMRAKQSTDTEHCTRLHKSIDAFEALYKAK
ncbi:MAG: superoxide dismutase [Kiritimatiellae bacterium]|nr:superoxide dismutase [Kiritimatiellia bacterium]